MCCVSALAIYYAPSEIKRVIVMVQQYCWMFTFIVYIGNGWLELVSAHLSHLRLLSLEKCFGVCDKDVAALVADLPELVVINSWGDIVGTLSKEMREIFYELRGEGEYFKRTDCRFRIF
jgi:hypothetical protein